MSTGKIVTLSVIAIIFLLVANFSVWLSANIFNRDSFVDTSVSVIQTERVREAVGAETVDQLFKESPIIKRVAGDTVESAVAGLLASKAATPVLNQVAEKTNILLTAPKPQAIAIDISTVKKIIKPVAAALSGGLDSDLSKKPLPDSIVLVKKGEVPSVYGWGITLLWLGPILGLIGLGIIIGLVWSAGAQARPSVLRICGTTLAIGSAVFIILVRILPAPVTASITSTNVRTIATSLMSAFLGKLTGQTWLLVLAGLVLIGVGYALPHSEEIPILKNLTAKKAA